MPPSSPPATTLALRLRSETAPLHEALDRRVMALQPFDSRERYACFVAAQYLFQRDVEPLYGAPALQALLPGLAQRSRRAAAQADLADLGVPLPPVIDPAAGEGLGLPEALGWLYVSEGSTLGAAFLLKEAGSRLGVGEDSGARHLAASPEGRGPAWKRFVQVLDTAPLSADEADRAVAGACAAFERFRVLLERSAPTA